MKKLLCLFSAALVALTSCSNDDDSSKSSSILVKKITEFENDKPVSKDIVYNGNKIVSITNADGSQAKFTYTGDFITKNEHFDEKGKLAGTDEYTYTNGKLTTYVEKEPGDNIYYYKTKYVHNADGTVSYEEFRVTVSTGFEEEYGEIGKLTFKDGNLIKAENSYYGYDSIKVYDYDVKNSPFKNITGYSLLLEDESVVNNIIKETRTSGSGANVNTSVTTYTYKYDTNNYPTEKVTTFPNGNSTSSETTQYFY
jgi:hypothetical protein